MANSNKILTVSYGTFSCTLEGFEDSFGAMKEIAEYFRGLAAEDRYFGSEPPAVDPEMLQDLARRRTRQSVEARHLGNDIHLRASVEDPKKDSGITRETPESAPVSEGGQDVADKLSRIRAAVDASMSAEPEVFSDDLTDSNLFDVDAPEDLIDAEVLETVERQPNFAEAQTFVPEPATADETAPEPAQEEPLFEPTTEPEVTFEGPLELEDEIAPEEPEPVEDQQSPTAAPTPPEDEAELSARANARLMALRREFEKNPPTAADLDPQFESSPQRHSYDGERKKRQLPSGGAEENSVSRLMDEAKFKLEGAENKRRHISIAHLKAAVAATKAERRSTSKDVQDRREKREQDPYRRDLAQAVGDPPKTQPPERDQPSQVAGKKRVPLMLVSEQRVTIETAPQPETQTASSRGGSFAEYAERVGANDLPELLEAAVAYAMLGSQENVVTRPQIMKTIAQHFGDDEFSREESLRAFGLLLREGRIQKLSQGQFAVPDNSPFIDRIPGE